VIPCLGVTAPSRSDTAPAARIRQGTHEKYTQDFRNHINEEIKNENNIKGGFRGRIKLV
jgi:hypothetical protein